MKRLYVMVLGLAAAVLLASPTMAQTPQQIVGSTVISFPVPAGQCEITARTPPESYYIAKISELVARSGERLISLYTDCAQLERFKASGSSLMEYAQYVAPIAAVESYYTSESLSRICAAAKSVPNKDALELLEKRGQENLDKVIPGVKVTEPKSLGVLLEEKDACYSGMVARVATAAGVDEVHLGIFVTVIVNGKLIVYRAYGPFRDSAGLADSLNRQKANIAAFISANTK